MNIADGPDSAAVNCSGIFTRMLKDTDRNRLAIRTQRPPNERLRKRYSVSRVQGPGLREP